MCGARLRIPNRPAGHSQPGLGKGPAVRASVCEHPRPGHSQPDKADAAVCVHPRPGHSQPDKADVAVCVHPRPGHSQPEKADVARSRNPNPVPGQSRPGSGEGTANYGFGVQLPGRGQPGGNPVPLAPGPFAGRSRPRSEPGASPGFLANLYDLHPRDLKRMHTNLLLHHNRRFQTMSPEKGWGAQGGQSQKETLTYI